MLSCMQLPSGISFADTGSGTAWDGTAADTAWYTGHESDSEFSIGSADQLAGLASLVNGGNTFAGKTVKLTADIDLGGGKNIQR